MLPTQRVLPQVSTSALKALPLPTQQAFTTGEGGFNGFTPQVVPPQVHFGWLMLCLLVNLALLARQLPQPAGYGGVISTNWIGSSPTRSSLISATMFLPITDRITRFTQL